MFGSASRDKMKNMGQAGVDANKKLFQYNPQVDPVGMFDSTYDDPYKEMREEESAVETYLQKRASGENLEADRVGAEKRKAYGDGLRSAMASSRGEYDPNLAVAQERALSRESGFGRAEQRMAGKEEQDLASAQLSDFENQLRSEQNAYTGAMQSFEASKNELQRKYDELTQAYIRDQYSNDIARRMARQSLAGSKLMTDVAMRRKELEDAAKSRSDALNVFKTILGVGTQVGKIASVL